MANKLPKLPGLILVQPHAQLVAERKKGIFVKSEAFKKYIDEEVYVVAKGKAYARITFSDPKKMDLKQFKAMRQRHKITEDERKQWWPRKRTLYWYKINLLESYLPPLAAKYPKGPQVFVKEVEVIAPKSRKSEQANKRQPIAVEDGVPIFDRDVSMEGPTHPMAKRLDDFIGNIGGDDVHDVIHGTLGNEPPPPTPARHRDAPIERQPINKKVMSKIDKYREKLGIGNKEIITQPEIVKTIKKQNPKKGLLARFSEKLNGG